jgi:hypothetical protein
MHCGQIAQQVEQGTENPRVGGSIPSLATPSSTPPRLLAAVAFFISGCALIQDDCEQLCDNVTNALAACADETWQGEAWTWADLGAGGRLAYARGCRRQWANKQVALTSRDLELALNECHDGQEVLKTLRCEELLDMYLASEVVAGDTDADTDASSVSSP